jgi:hypothetical protein
MTSKSLHHPLYREALDTFHVSASQTAHHLTPALPRWLWPAKSNPPVSIATLCEVILVAAFAARTGRDSDFKAYLAAKGLAPKPEEPQDGATQ